MGYTEDHGFLGEIIRRAEKDDSINGTCQRVGEMSVGRPVNIAVSERIYDCVSQHPGRRQGYIAQALGLEEKNFGGRLAAMERTQLLLCEDEHGGLFPHSRRGVLSKWLMENTD